MNDNTQKLNTIFAVILVSASVFLVVGRFNKYDSLRPSQSTSEPYPTVGSQTVTARLWQDPFEALKTLTNSSGQSKSGPLVTSFRAKTQTGSEEVAILGVMLEGTPYPEDAEVRRRLRYAVEVALLTAEFSPEDRNHIGVDSLGLDYAARQPFQTTKLNVAFEWFTLSKPDQSRTVLVLWLREDDFANAPLRTLGAMLTALGMTEAAGTRFYLIGPRSSNTLKSMAEEPTDALAGGGLADRFHIYSPEATAPDRALFASATNSTGGRSWIESERFATNSGRGTFQNWIATDDEICKKLVAELVNRRIGPKLDPGDRIVLISEADTFYGRLLPTVFTEALTNVCGTQAVSNVLRFGYLRGLEGIKARTEDENARKTKAANTPEGLVQAALEKSGERAEGEAQNDYAQRLAEFLAQEDLKLRRDYGRIKAVGLMGSDVYDKLLLLQALRYRLPQTLFFTTDLDARFWMPPDQLRYTRNLLVASAYPVSPEIPQEQFLPFRDVYQTAVFKACQGALRHVQDSTILSPPVLTGEVYEIGRRGPVALNLPESTDQVRSGQDVSSGNIWLKFPTEFRYALAGLIATLGPVLLAIVLLGGFHRSRTPRTSERKTPDPQADIEPELPQVELELRPKWSSFGWTVVAVILFLGVCLLAGGISEDAGEEPWSFTEGVSIWPTQAFRLLALGMSIAFIFVAARRNERHRLLLWRSFFSSGGNTAPPPAAGFSLEFRDWLRHCLQSKFGSRKESVGLRSQPSESDCPGIRINRWRVPMADQSHVDASQLFLDYNRMGHRSFRHARAWMMALSYLGLAALFLGLTNGIPDRLCVRGPQSLRFDSLLLAFSVLGFLLVLFYTLDAARLASKMLKHIARPTCWPPWLLTKWSRAKCVRPEDLDGWLDVQFAAAKTRETGRLLIYPFVIFLLLLLARHDYFDNWSWPTSLKLIFAFNFLLAAACWWFVRQAARHVKRRALSDLNNAIVQIANGEREKITTPAPAANIQSAGPEAARCVYTRESYAKRLGELRKEIEEERRAAFGHWIQDPTYLALFIPTGVTGLITILLGYWLNRQ